MSSRVRSISGCPLDEPSKAVATVATRRLRPAFRGQLQQSRDDDHGVLTCPYPEAFDHAARPIRVTPTDDVRNPFRGHPSPHLGENQSMQPEMDFKVLVAPDVAPPPSAARLAAEAFFAPATTTAPQAPAATPVVWRKKAIAEPAPSDASPDPEPIDAARRTPRVFRIEPAAAKPQAAPSPTPSPLATIPEGLASLPESPSVPRLRRRKSPRLHGDVTIIRPPQDRPLPAGTGISDGDPASATVPRERRGAPVRPTDGAGPRYLKLLARIRLLQAQAERARQREAAAAIRWIKRDIDRYGLTAKDLGLR